MPAWRPMRGHDAVHGSSVDGCVVIGDESTLLVRMCSALVAVQLGEESDEVGVEWDEPVVAEFADRDA